jgi:hypothetical protein
MRQQQRLLARLLPHVRSGGIYILEDLHTSFRSKVAVEEDLRTADEYARRSRLRSSLLLPVTLDHEAAFAHGLRLEAPAMTFLEQKESRE